MKSVVAVCLLLGSLCGCVLERDVRIEREFYAEQKADFEASRLSKNGLSERGLVETWGPPSTVYVVESTSYLIYRRPRQKPVFSPHYGTRYVTAICDITFRLEGGLVTGSNYRGDCYGP